MYRFFSHLKFLSKATNEHGVHSPFVYAFVTKCLYSKTKFNVSKTVNVLLKMLDYFNIQKIHLVNENATLSKTINEQFDTIEFDNSSADFIYINTLKNVDIYSVLLKNKAIHNESIIFIDCIIEDRELWNTLIKNEKFTVSINLFYCGILFFRREQVKEDFKIRI